MFGPAPGFACFHTLVGNVLGLGPAAGIVSPDIKSLWLAMFWTLLHCGLQMAMFWLCSRQGPAGSAGHLISWYPWPLLACIIHGILISQIILQTLQWFAQRDFLRLYRRMKSNEILCHKTCMLIHPYYYLTSLKIPAHKVVVYPLQPTDLPDKIKIIVKQAIK